MNGSTSDGESIVGDECHIIARETEGPRGGEEWPNGLDSHTNLILLCRVHHKFVDDQPNRFTSNVLRRLKRAHEEWVHLALGIKEESPEVSRQPMFAWRLQSSGDILGLMSRAEAFQFVNPDPSSAEEAELIGSFLQNVYDYGEMLGDMDPASRVRAQYSMKEELSILEEQGFAVFGLLVSKPFNAFGNSVPLSTAVIHVIRADDQDIMELSAE